MKQLGSQNTEALKGGKLCKHVMEFRVARIFAAVWSEAVMIHGAELQPSGLSEIDARSRRQIRPLVVQMTQWNVAIMEG